jgi:hypothetical protein
VYDSENESEAGIGSTMQRSHAELAHAAMVGLPVSLDSKATFFAALLTAVLWFQYKSLDASVLVLPQNAATAERFAAAYLYLFVTFVALFCCYMVVVPRIGGDKKLLFSFVSFAHRKRPEDVLSDFAAYGGARGEEAVLRHCYELSHLCVRKTRWLRAAFIIGTIALVLFLGLQAVGVTGFVPEFTHYRAA